MGCYIGAVGSWPRRGLRRPDRDQVFADIEKIITSRITDPLLRRMMNTHVDEETDTLHVALHVAAEPVEFVWKRGEVTVSAKTSTVGAGYHLWVLGLLEEIARQSGFEWAWDENTTREPARVSAEMASWVRALATVLVKDHTESDLVLVSLPLLNAMPNGYCGVLTPSGPKDWAWVRRVADGAADAPGELFIWESPSPEADFWRKTGESIMWMDVPWHPPADDRERELMELALDCLARACEKDPAAALPIAEMEELAAMLKADPDNPPTPASTGIGFRRGLMDLRLMAGWRLQLPGYFYEFEEDDGQTLGFAFRDRVVRFSSMSLTGDGGERPPRELLWRQCLESEVDGRVLWQSDADTTRVVATAFEEDGETGVMVRGEVVRDGEIGLVTVTIADQADEPWAASVTRAVECDSEDADDQTEE